MSHLVLDTIVVMLEHVLITGQMTATTRSNKERISAVIMPIKNVGSLSKCIRSAPENGEEFGNGIDGTTPVLKTQMTEDEVRAGSEGGGRTLDEALGMALRLKLRRWQSDLEQGCNIK
jgi:hypothetical protein